MKLQQPAGRQGAKTGGNRSDKPEQYGIVRSAGWRAVFYCKSEKTNADLGQIKSDRHLSEKSKNEKD